MPALQVCVNLLVSWQNDFKTEVESKTFSEAMHQKVKKKKKNYQCYSNWNVKTHFIKR